MDWNNLTIDETFELDYLKEQVRKREDNIKRIAERRQEIDKRLQDFLIFEGNNQSREEEKLKHAKKAYWRFIISKEKRDEKIGS